MTIEISSNDVLELTMLRDRLERERRTSHQGDSFTNARTNDLDREVEVLSRLLRKAAK